MADFFAPYHVLERPARLAALAFGIAYPNGMTRAQVARMLTRAGIRLESRAIPASRYQAACGAAVAADIVCDDGPRGALRARADWAPWLTLRAWERDRLDPILKAYQLDFPSYVYQLSDADAAMLLRCHTVAGRFDRIDTAVRLVQPGDWNWLTRPGVSHLLATLPAKYVDAAFAACFNETVRRAAPPEPILEAVRDSSAEPARHAAAVAFIRVLQGDKDEALAVFADLPEDLRESKPARSGMAATHALLATLRGDDAAAIEHIDAAIAAEKAGTRKRNVFPPSSAFTLSLLSLVRDHTPANATKVDHLVRIGSKLDLDRSMIEAVVMAVRARDGWPSYWGRTRYDATFDRFVEGMAACWWDDFPEDAAGGRCMALKRYGAAAAKSGYRWLAAECMEILDRWELAAKSADAALAGIPEPAGEGGTRDWVALAAKLHRELGTRTLADVAAPAAEWELALRGIEQVAFEAGKTTARRKKAAVKARSRLAWVLEYSALGGVTASAREQRATRAGGWTKGRPVSLKRLYSQAGTMDFLIDQDRAAAGKIVHNTSRWSSLPRYYLPAAGVFALAGHPYVVDEAGDPVEVVRRDPELLLREREGRLLALVDPHVNDASDSHLVQETGDMRLEVTLFTPRHKKLCEVIPPEGVELPAEAKDRLVEAVSAMAGEIRVQGLIGDGAGLARQVEADPGPWVRLEPSGPGLAVALLVEPVAGSGTLQAELRPYQEEGYRWLARLSRLGAGACLADDMGLGKTVQTLAALLDRGADGAALVVAPTSVVANWLDEARRFAPTLKVRAYTGPAASRAGKLEDLGPFDLVVTTYGLMHNDVDALADVDWSTVVLDEAQAIKNPATKRAKAARKLPARFRLVTTGTPIQNNVVDLYSLFSFLNPGMLGSARRFRENFAHPIERDRDPAARTRLRRLIAPYVLRRIKSDVLDDLPPRTEVTLQVEMSPEEAALYEALRLRAMEDLEALAGNGNRNGAGVQRTPAAGAGPPDEAAAGVLQPEAGSSRRPAELQARDLRHHAGRAAARPAQGARLLPVRPSPEADRGTLDRNRRPLPVPRRFHLR